MHLGVAPQARGFTGNLLAGMDGWKAAPLTGGSIVELDHLVQYQGGSSAHAGIYP